LSRGGPSARPRSSRGLPGSPHARDINSGRSAQTRVAIFSEDRRGFEREGDGSARSLGTPRLEEAEGVGLSCGGPSAPPRSSRGLPTGPHARDTNSGRSARTHVARFIRSAPRVRTGGQRQQEGPGDAADCVSGGGGIELRRAFGPSSLVSRTAETAAYAGHQFGPLGSNPRRDLLRRSPRARTGGWHRQEGPGDAADCVSGGGGIELRRAFGPSSLVSRTAETAAYAGHHLGPLGSNPRRALLFEARCGFEREGEESARSLGTRRLEEAEGAGFEPAWACARRFSSTRPGFPSGYVRPRPVTGV